MALFSTVTDTFQICTVDYFFEVTDTIRISTVEIVHGATDVLQIDGVVSPDKSSHLVADSPSNEFFLLLYLLLLLFMPLSVAAFVLLFIDARCCNLFVYFFSLHTFIRNCSFTGDCCLSSHCMLYCCYRHNPIRCRRFPPIHCPSANPSNSLHLFALFHCNFRSIASDTGISTSFTWFNTEVFVEGHVPS